MDAAHAPAATRSCPHRGEAITIVTLLTTPEGRTARTSRQRQRRHPDPPRLTVTLHPDDGVELAEMLSFIRDWLATDAAQLAPSLRRFVGADGYDLAELINDLARFAFLLGGNGEEQFGLDST